MTTIDEPRAGAGIVEKGRETAEGPGPDVMATSTLDGNKLLSVEGDDIGKLKGLCRAKATGVKSRRTFSRSEA